MMIGKESSLAGKQLFCVLAYLLVGQEGKCLVQVVFHIDQA